MLTFQQIIFELSLFWEKQGCILHQGHDLEVGAGTFNPATFFRSLGPEPYATAYVEPSRRPSDGRYGENPNRVQLFHQYQVLLKPSPPNVLHLYLKSLEAIGIKLKEHDIRFVHSDWESPTLGAWGLGWEVWCDGMEVSQFTYFQAMGSQPLKPISAEITYGLERLAMYIQEVDSIFDIQWNESLSFRDISHRSEVEWSNYNFNEASIPMWLQHFDDYEKEAKALIARQLALPAYDFILKASHAFNILDARGALSTQQRARYIGRVRDLARLCAAEYLAFREKEGFPLALKEETLTPKISDKTSVRFDSEKRQDFLLEIGSEELPATFVPIGCMQLEKGVADLLKAHDLAYHSFRILGTPRRLSLLIEGLVEGSTAKTIQRKGPALSAAFDASGKATPQGEGFFKSLKILAPTLNAIRQGKIKGLEILSFKENEYLYATVSEPGISTFSLLSEKLPSLILGLDFPKKMRWGNQDISYARPLHWITALFGKKIVPFTVGNIVSGRSTFGHAQRDPKKLSLKEPKEYLSLLRKHFVIVDIEERKEQIESQLDAIEKKLSCRAVEREKILKEVLYLTEYPELVVGNFDPSFLKAPPEVLISEMVEHQKYFPLENLYRSNLKNRDFDKEAPQNSCPERATIAERQGASEGESFEVKPTQSKTDSSGYFGTKGTLLNHFVITADNKPSQLICKGNEKVLSARLNDGVFLYNQDLKTPLEEFNEKLKAMTFQKELGSMFDKVMRITAIGGILNQRLAIADDSLVLRAALLCKSDLVSQLVGEFPELQGTAGKYYALAQKEPKEVALAIEEHWMPRAEGGSLPTTPVGIILSLADKIDNLLSYFSIGLKPTSSSDPYGLRRQAIGLIKILIDGKHLLDLRELFLACSQQFPLLKREVIEEILLFVTQRVKGVLEDAAFKKEEIAASLQGVCINPFDQFCKMKALHEFRTTGTAFEHLIEVYKRAKGQLETKATAPFNPSLAHEPAERELLRGVHTLEEQWNTVLSERNYIKAFHLLAGLQPKIAHLFDSVKILADDPSLRNNRIALLQKVFSYFAQLLDFNQIRGD